VARPQVGLQWPCSISCALRVGAGGSGAGSGAPRRRGTGAVSSSEGRLPLQGPRRQGERRTHPVSVSCMMATWAQMKATADRDVVERFTSPLRMLHDAP